MTIYLIFNITCPACTHLYQTWQLLQKG